MRIRLNWSPAEVEAARADFAGVLAGLEIQEEEIEREITRLRWRGHAQALLSQMTQRNNREAKARIDAWRKRK